MPKTYHIKTFGCQMNYADSEKVDMILRSAWLRKVLDPVQADIVILNTCSVRQKWEDKVWWYIQEIVKYHKAHTPPEKDIRKVVYGITGCMVRKSGVARRYLVGIDGEYVDAKYKRVGTTKIAHTQSVDTLANYDDELFLRSPHVDFVFRIEEVAYTTKLLSLVYATDIGNDAKYNEYLQVQQLQENPASANVIIQTGCDNYCTFCIVPYTRGREVSRPHIDIVAEIRSVVSSGTQEVTLLGQNVNSYGKETKKKLWDIENMQWIQSISSTSMSPIDTWKEDISEKIPSKGETSEDPIHQNSIYPQKTPFRELLESISQIRWLGRVRFTSSNPHDMTPDILGAYFDLPHISHYLHLALQSGCDAVLKQMNRKHTYADFLAQVRYLRSRDPLFSISTDIIVGFPGETEEQFQQTVHAMQECVFDFAYIARYSPRTGTRASSTMPDDIPASEKARRWNILDSILKESVHTRNMLMVWRTEYILVSSKWKDDVWVGRTENFKEVHIPYTKDVHIGSLAQVYIESIDGWILCGRVV